MELEPYCYIRFERIKQLSDGTNDYHNREILYSYDIPRRLMKKYEWLIRWRNAKLQCLHPRDKVQYTFGFYDKKTGIDIGFRSVFAKLTSAKGQVTKVKNKIQAAKESYIGDLFHPTIETTDAYKAAICKLEAYEQKVEELTRLVEDEKNKMHEKL